MRITPNPIKSVFFSLLFLSTKLSAQDFSVSYEKTIGGDFYESMQALKMTDGSGYLFFGNSLSGISGDKTEASRGGYDIWLVRTDNQYNILWDKTIGGSGNDEISGFQIIENSIYLACSSNSPISGEKTLNNFGDLDIWLLKLDLNGTIIWQNVYGGINEENLPKLAKNNQDQLVLACDTRSSNSGNFTETNHGIGDVWVGVIDTLDGTILNQRMIGSSQNEALAQLKIFGNRTFIQLYGYIGGDGDIPPLSPNFDQDIILIELDNSLAIQNTKRFWGDNDDFPGDLLQDNTGNFYSIHQSDSPISGNKTSASYGSVGNPDIWILKLDASLNVIWDKTYGGSMRELIAYGVSYVDNGGNLVVLCPSNSSSGTGVKLSQSYGGYDNWLLTIDPQDGSLIREVTFGGSQDDYARSAIQVNTSGSLLITSSSSSPISGNKGVGTNGLEDLWLLELDASDYLTIKESDVHASHTFFPNPFEGKVNLTLATPNQFNLIRFYSIDGKLLFESTLDGGQHFFVEFPENQAVILYELIGETYSERGKLISR